jgi:negative regulator of sigma E activity
MSHDPDRHPADQLSAYLDGEMTRDERDAIELHLAACPACRAALQDYRALAAAAADEATPPVPADLHTRIRRRIDAVRPAGVAATALGPATGRSVPAAGRRFLPSYRLALAVAASALLVIGLWAVRPDRPEAPSSEPRQEVAQSADTVRPERKEMGRIEEAPPARPAPSAQPVSPAPSEGSSVDRALADRLRSLGYLGSGASRPEPAAPTKSVAPPSAEPPALVEEAGPIGDAYRDAAEARAAGGAGAPPASLLAGTAPFVAPPVRWIEFDYGDHRISVSETGSMTIRSEKYACSIEPGAEGLDPSAVPELFAAADAALPGNRPAGAAIERKSDTPKVRLTAGPEPADAPRAGASPYAAAPPPPAPRAAPSRTAAPEAKAAPQPPPEIPAAAADDLDRRLRALLRERYLRLLEERCGPFPPPIRPD